MSLPDYKVERDGTILVGGRAVGYVNKIDQLVSNWADWRAEVGTPNVPETYRVRYAETRKEAVEQVLAAVSGP